MTEFNDYKSLTYDILSNVLKSKLLLGFSLRSFTNFPNNIHQEVKNPWEKALAYTLEERNAAIQGTTIEGRDDVVLEGDRLLMPYFGLHQLASKDANKSITSIEGKPMLVNNVDFNQQILEQNLVYFVGIIEGYIYDSVRIIYQNIPEKLASHNLSMEFSDIIKQENFDELMEQMIEMAVGRKWSEGGFSKRIEKLRSKFGINLGFKRILQEFLDEANLIRNCILHNGSKVSSDYFKEYGEKRTLQLNTPVVISSYFLDCLYYLAIDFVKILFVETSNLAWTPNKKTEAEIWAGSIGSSGFYKDVITKEENWIYKELHENGIL